MCGGLADMDFADIDWMLISLRRTPERLEAFRSINADRGVPYQLLEAVDGRELRREDLLAASLITDDISWGPGALGAAMSHRLCWEHARETGRPVGILEDDVYLRRDFVARVTELCDLLVDGWEIIHLGYNTDSLLDVEVAPGCRLRGGYDNLYPTVEQCERFVLSEGPVAPVSMDLSFGNCCYLVSPKGAERLIEGCFPLSNTSQNIPVLQAALIAKSKDALMNGMYWKMASYVCVPPVAMPLNDKSVSTIGVV